MDGAPTAEQARSMSIPKRWPLVAQPENRSDSPLKDARLVNCYAEKMGEQYQVEKRPGSQLLISMGSLGGFGLYNWLNPYLPSSGYLTGVYGTQVYLLTPTHPWAVVGTIPDVPLNQYCSFVEIPTKTPTMVLGYGPTASTYILGDAPVQITDPNYPDAVPGFVCLDGTVYAMDAQGGIHGSDIEDPTTWNALNVIYAQNESDAAVGLAKQLTYVVALKSTSTQFFYDAGGEYPASPLAPVPGAMLNYGCLSSNTVQELDGVLFWVTSSPTVAAQVLMLENLQMKIISTPAIDRMLELAGTSEYNSYGFLSFSFKYAGHKFYGLTQLGLNITLVYDIGEHLWYQWTDSQGNYFPAMAFGRNQNNNLVMQQYPVGNICLVGADYEIPHDAGKSLPDMGVLFPVDIYTPNFDAGVDRIKYLSQMRINADQTPGSLLQVRCSDDDYQPWDNFRTIDLSRTRPILNDEGSFYRRAYHFRHYANTAFRIRSCDLQMDIGTL